MNRAEQIKSEIKKGFETFAPNEMMTKATKFILGIQNDSFWMQEAKPYIGKEIGLIMEFAGAGLLIEGPEGGKVAKINQESGEITIEARR